jgi:hypothetical protein
MIVFRVSATTIPKGIFGNPVGQPIKWLEVVKSSSSSSSSSVMCSFSPAVNSRSSSFVSPELEYSLLRSATACSLSSVAR